MYDIILGAVEAAINMILCVHALPVMYDNYVVLQSS
jgi:hypothetical protein